LKEKITSQPVLFLPKRKGKFRVENNASGHGIGGVLSQEQEGKWKPIAFLSRTIQPAERNYKIYNEKLLKIVDVSQIRYSLVVILKLNSVSEVQYKDMMIDR